MKGFRVSGFGWIIALWLLFLGGVVSVASRPKDANIGALSTFDSIIGRAAVPAIQAAVSDINSNTEVLGGTTLNLIMRDTNCSGFIGTVEALELFESDVFTIIGPQSSGLAHIVSFAANELRIPLLSYGATDPTLSALENEYFVRTTQNDYFQMYAIAEFVDYFGWNDVIAIYTDDDYGRNGIAALEDTMTLKNAKISYKAALSPKASGAEVIHQLVQVNLMESRVYVVHVNPDSGLGVFSVAESLEMLSSGYVWIATDWLPSLLDSTEPENHDIMSPLQGVVAFRHHTPDSSMKNAFTARWKNLQHKQSWGGYSDFNSYALYAYDSVWLAAAALELYFEEGGSLSFSPDPNLAQINGSTLNLSSLRIFNEGEEFLKALLSMNFTGMIGNIQFDSDRNMMNPAYDILNIGGTGLGTVGYWSNHSGLSSVPPEKFYTLSDDDDDESSSRNLSSIIWPGGSSTTPRGWVFPNNGEPLRIVVPYRISYTEFVAKVNNTLGVEGFCIDVFEASISLLPYPVPHIYEMFGNGIDRPVYEDLVYTIYQKKYDAGVGDITIATNRTKIVAFTQPYMESGLVIIVPVKVAKSNAWAFLQPFTTEMWFVTATFFFFVGIVVWLLEHRINSEFRGSPRQQIITICWFSLSTMFFAHRENTVSAMGRLVLIIWLFVVLIINSSYTASLTSILTVQQLTTGIQGIDTLIASTDPIGVQGGSFASTYLTDELRIAKNRLHELNTPDAYADALSKGPKHGGVAAIVDELPYVQLFLSKSDCNFQIVGQAFTKSGWGFIFQKDTPLAVDLSTAILQLSETGQLQKIKDEWLSAKDDCSTQINGDTSQLSLNSFWGLFLICGSVCFVALVTFFVKVCMQYRRFASEVDDKSIEQMPSEPGSSRRASRTTSLKDVIYFVDRKEEEVLEVLKRKSSFNKSEGRISIDGQVNMNLPHYA